MASGNHDVTERAARVLHADRKAQWSEIGVSGVAWEQLDEQNCEVFRRNARALAAAGLLADPAVQARIDAGTAEANRVIAEAETWRASHNPACECERADAAIGTARRILNALTEGDPKTCH